ncbi:MAG: primosomal protein N', partial [Candidatus Tectomicrobia bacterium]|nr:primosomal protein N' [Candidatus Tectomicrobia bacterium]
MNPMYAQVVVPLPFDSPFTYRVPEALQEKLQVGCQVYVPFQHRRLAGYVVEITSQCSRERVREILAILDEVPFLNEELLSLTRWMADYYLAPWGEVIKIALPAAIHLKGTRYLAITPAGREALKAGEGEGELRAILQRIARRKRIRRDSLI